MHRDPDDSRETRRLSLQLAVLILPLLTLVSAETQAQGRPATLCGVGVSVGPESVGADDLDITNDSGTFLTYRGQSLLDQRTIDNTADAVRDLVYREKMSKKIVANMRAACMWLGRYRLWADVDGGYATQALTYTLPGGEERKLDGGGSVWGFGGGVRYYLIPIDGDPSRFFISTDVRYERFGLTNGTQTPAITVPGGTVGNLNLSATTRRVEYGGIVGRTFGSNGRAEFGAGVKYFSNRYDIDRFYVANSTSAPDVRIEANTTTALEKSGLRGVATTRVSFGRYSLGGSVAANTSSWKANLGLRANFGGF